MARHLRRRVSVLLVPDDVWVLLLTFVDVRVVASHARVSHAFERSVARALADSLAVVSGDVWRMDAHRLQLRRHLARLARRGECVQQVVVIGDEHLWSWVIDECWQRVPVTFVHLTRPLAGAAVPSRTRAVDWLGAQLLAPGGCVNEFHHRIARKFMPLYLTL